MDSTSPATIKHPFLSEFLFIKIISNTILTADAAVTEGHISRLTPSNNKKNRNQRLLNKQQQELDATTQQEQQRPPPRR